MLAGTLAAGCGVGGPTSGDGGRGEPAFVPPGGVMPGGAPTEPLPGEGRLLDAFRPRIDVPRGPAFPVDGGTGTLDGGGGTAGGDGGGEPTRCWGHDDDCDGVYASCDNCPTMPNASQLDEDRNGVGDACDVPCGNTGWLTISVDVRGWDGSDVADATSFDLWLAPSSMASTQDRATAEGDPWAAELPPGTYRVWQGEAPSGYVAADAVEVTVEACAFEAVRLEVRQEAPPPPPPGPTAESCADGVDEDQDGLADCDDPDCVDSFACAVALAELPLRAAGLTGPSGVLVAGTSTFTADGSGLCRLELQGDGTYAKVPATCLTDAGAPGQLAYDPSTGFAYLPDRGAGSAGVWRYSYDVATDAFVDPLAIGGSLGALGPSTAAVGAGGELYVGTADGGLHRIRFASGLAGEQVVEPVGTTRSGTAARGLACDGVDLYLAEDGGVTMLASVDGCSTCTPGATPIAAFAPTAIASDGLGTVYVAEPLGGASIVIRYTAPIVLDELFASTGVLPGDVPDLLWNVSALGVDLDGNVFVADDPSGAGAAGEGRLFMTPLVP